MKIDELKNGMILKRKGEAMTSYKVRWIAPKVIETVREEFYFGGVRKKIEMISVDEIEEYEVVE